MNSTTTNISTAPVLINSTSTQTGSSQLEFWLILIFSYGLFGGLIAPICNGAMVIGIIRNKHFRTRFYIILSFLLSSRVCLGIQNMTMFIHRTLRTLAIVETNLNRAICYILQMQTYYILTMEMVFLLGLVLDRILAIIAFKYYRTLTYRDALTVCTIASACTIFIKLGPSIFAANFFRGTVACINSNSPMAGAWYLVYTQYIDVVLGVFTLIAYAGLISYVRFIFLPKIVAKSSHRGRDKTGEAAFKQHQRLLPVLTRLVFVHCGLSLLSRIFSASQSILPQQVASRVIAYGGVPVVMDYLSNIALLLISDKDLRRAAFNCSGTQVIPIQITGPVTSTRQRQPGGNNRSHNTVI